MSAAGCLPGPELCGGIYTQDPHLGGKELQFLQGELERQAEAVRAWLQERDATGQAKQKITPELQLMSGPPAPTLDTIAAKDGYGLLVVGARGAGMSSVLLGSVATKLAARASVPVLVIGDQVRKGRAERRLRSVDRAEAHP